MNNADTALTAILVLSNVGFITLSLSLLYPKYIQRYQNKKKQREIQEKQERINETRQIVNEYLKELQKED